MRANQHKRRRAAPLLLLAAAACCWPGADGASTSALLLLAAHGDLAAYVCAPGVLATAAAVRRNQRPIRPKEYVLRLFLLYLLLASPPPPNDPCLQSPSHARGRAADRGHRAAGRRPVPSNSNRAATRAEEEGNPRRRRLARFVCSLARCCCPALYSGFLAPPQPQIPPKLGRSLPPPVVAMAFRRLLLSLSQPNSARSPPLRRIPSTCLLTPCPILGMTRGPLRLRSRNIF